MTIFAAKTINYLYSGDFHNALIWLLIEIVSILVREVCLYFHCAFFGKHFGIIRKNITRKIYDKILTVEETGIKTFSSEKIINIAQNNLDYSCTLPEYFSNICRFIIEILIAFVSIFTTNYIAGFAVLGLGVVNYFFYSFMNKRLGNIMNDRFAKKDKSFQEYSKIILGKPVIEEMEASEQFKNQLLDHVSDFNVSYGKYQRVLSFRDNVHWALWNVIVYAVSAVLIFMISQNKFELSLYLIIVPYLKSCSEKLNDLYKKFGDFENVRVDVDRVNTILSLTDKQLLTYGDMSLSSKEDGELCLIDVHYKSTNQGINIDDLNMNFAMNSVNIVKGERGCGKRVVFDLLRRKIKPDRGKVLLNNLNLYDYSSKTFKNHIEYCASHPVFISGTVKENLLLANNNFKQIKDLIKDLQLENKILALDKGYETNIADIKDGETLF